MGTGSEESAEAQSMKVAPVQDSVLEHVRKTSYQGTLDVDLDRTYDEKLFIAEIHLIRSDHHSMIDEVGRPPFDQYVSSAEQLMILEQLHEYLVPESSCQGQLPVSEVRIQEQGSYHSEKERRVNSSGVFEMSLGNGGEMEKYIFPMRLCMDWEMARYVWRSVWNISAGTISAAVTGSLLSWETEVSLLQTVR